MTAFPRNRNAGEAGTKGCVIGCLAALVVVPLIVILCGYLLLMHSSVPLRLVAVAMNAADGITIDGVGGSISSGFTIDELRITDEDGRESVMEGVALKWKGIIELKKSRQLIIEEIALERAHFFIDTSELDADGQGKAGEDSDGTAGEISSDKGTELELFEIRKIDVREVVFESTSGDFKLELDEFALKGLRIEGDDFALEDLSIGSNFVDLQLEDAGPAQIGETSVPFKRQLRGVVKAPVHEALLRDIDFTAEMGAVEGKMVTRIRLLGGAVEFVNLGEGRLQSMEVKQLTLADWVSASWGALPENLSMKVRSGGLEAEAEESNELQAEAEETAVVEGGGFRIGLADFTIEPQVLRGADGMEAPILAHCDHAGLSITAALENVDDPPYFRVSLASEPRREPRELMALILHDKPFTDLAPDEATQVDEAVERYVSSKLIKP